MGLAQGELLAERRVGGEKPLREPHAARLGGDRRVDAVRPDDDELRRAAADVDDQRPRCEPAAAQDAGQRQLRLLLAAQQCVS